MLFPELFFKILYRAYSSGLHVSNAAINSLQSFQLVIKIMKLLIGVRPVNVAHLLEEVYRGP